MYCPSLQQLYLVPQYGHRISTICHDFATLLPTLNHQSATSVAIRDDVRKAIAFGRFPCHSRRSSAIAEPPFTIVGTTIMPQVIAPGTPPSCAWSGRTRKPHPTIPQPFPMSPLRRLEIQCQLGSHTCRREDVGYDVGCLAKCPNIKFPRVCMAAAHHGHESEVKLPDVSDIEISCIFLHS